MIEVSWMNEYVAKMIISRSVSFIFGGNAAKLREKNEQSTRERKKRDLP